MPDLNPALTVALCGVQDPRSFCEEVTLCPDENPPTPMPTTTPMPSKQLVLNNEQAGECEECQFVTHLMMKMLGSNITEVCCHLLQIFPTKYESYCTSAVVGVWC